LSINEGDEAMAKYKHYNYSQTVLLPVSLEDQLMPGTLEFTIHTLVENRLDLSRFEERFKNDETGCRAYDPKILLKVVLLAYARGITTSRKIERVCRENVIFMALSCWQHPDHSTIAAFVSTMKEQIQSLFRDVLMVCDEMNLLGGTEFSLDGCRLPSNASKRWSGTFAGLKEKKDKLEHKVKQLLEEQVAADKKDEKAETDRARRDKQVEKLKKQAERIERFLGDNKAKPGKQWKEIKSNVTDNESAMMHTPHGVTQGYNGQALVDAKHQVIVQAEAFGYGQDHYHVAPMIDGAKENMQAIGHTHDWFRDAILSADSAYHSSASIKKCEQEGLDGYIPDKDYRKRNPEFSRRLRAGVVKQKRLTREDFSYDEKKDQYECPKGKRLKHVGGNTKAYGNVYRRYLADAKDCRACQVRNRCMCERTGKGNKGKSLMIPIGIQGRNYSKEMAAKMDTARGKKMYPRRIAIVEPVFANIRIQKMLNRFTLRGKAKVNIQWLLYCMVHNIEKISNYGYSFAAG